MSDQTRYSYSGPREGSRYAQYFLKGWNLRAETLYRATVGVEPMTPQEAASDFDVPVAAMLEAIHYCLHNAELLQREREEDWEESSSRGLVQSTQPSSGA
jgi:hypothetical protein